MSSKIMPLVIAGAASLTAFAAGVPAQSQPPQSQDQGMTQTCAFTSGPRNGQTFDYTGYAGAVSVPIGSPCADLQGSNGSAVAPAGPRGQSSPYINGPLPSNSAGPFPETAFGRPMPGYTFACQFSNGQTQDFTGKLGAVPVAIGAPCSNGVNQGVGVGPGR